MEASQEFPLVPQVQLHQKYWTTEDSKAKLFDAGARCLDIVTETAHYYDMASDELATAQLWLSKRNQQWCLIVESQKQPVEANTNSSAPEIREPPRQGKTDNSNVHKGTQERRPTRKGSSNDQHGPQHDLNEESKTNRNATSSSVYVELVDESEIITRLADFLRIDLKTEKEGNVTMEGFLRNAGIQHYATHHIVHQATYKLGKRHTILMQRDGSALKETATVLTEVDISNICKGFEEIEKLANYLGFVQSEPGFKTDSMATCPFNLHTVSVGDI